MALSRWIGTIEVPDGYNGRRTVLQLVRERPGVTWAVWPGGYFRMGSAPKGTEVRWLRAWTENVDLPYLRELV